MYWIFFLLLVVTALVPDIVRGPLSFLPEIRVEEILIFLLGSAAFFTFVKNEERISFQRKEKEKAQKKADQTVKDLVDSYSYIGEVNRKMDLLMGIAFGLSDKSVGDKRKESEVHDSILNATNFLLKADESMLRFVNMETLRTEKETKAPSDSKISVSNKDLAVMSDDDIHVRKSEDVIIISSPQKIGSLRCFLIAKGYDPDEESKPKNTDILKLFASQAIFLHSYTCRKK